MKYHFVAKFGNKLENVEFAFISENVADALETAKKIGKSKLKKNGYIVRLLIKQNFKFLKLYEQTGPISSKKNTTWYDIFTGEKITGNELEKFILKLKVSNL